MTYSENSHLKTTMTHFFVVSCSRLIVQEVLRTEYAVTLPLTISEYYILMKGLESVPCASIDKASTMYLYTWQHTGSPALEFKVYVPCLAFVYKCKNPCP